MSGSQLESIVIIKCRFFHGGGGNDFFPVQKNRPPVCVISQRDVMPFFHELPGISEIMDIFSAGGICRFPGMSRPFLGQIAFSQNQFQRFVRRPPDEEFQRSCMF